jgi:anion-transporting  ArsA/GET3 family ATPase
LKEWSLLGKAWYHATEDEPDGRARFDVVLFDAPATGHGLDMLRVPKVIVDIAPPGVLRSDAERAWDMFRDPSRSGVVVVTLPEEMPTNETIELCSALRTELTLPIAELVVNAHLPRLFLGAERDRVAGLGALDAATPARAVLASGARRALRERIQDECLARLGVIGAPLRTLDFLPDGAATPSAIAQLAQRFGGAS